MLDHRSEDVPPPGPTVRTEAAAGPAPSALSAPSTPSAPLATDSGQLVPMPRLVSAERPWRRIDVDGVCFDEVSVLQIVEHVRSEWGQGRGGVLLTLDVARRRHRREEVRGLALRADLVVADEARAPWHRLRRVAGRALDGVPAMPLLWALTRAAAVDRRRVMVIAGPPGGGREVAGILEATVPDLDDVSWHEVVAGLDDDPGVNADLLVALGGARPDLVLVSPDVPSQGDVALRLRGMLPDAWFVACGAGASFASESRPPRHSRDL